MRRLLAIAGLIAFSGCGSDPPIPKDKDAIEQEVKREKEIRQGLEGAKSVPAKSPDKIK